MTSSLLNSTASGTTADSTPGASRLDSGTSTFDHSGIENADTQTDDGGDVSAMRRYDAFGNPVAAWGGWQGPFGYGGPYGYQTDPDHGLMLLGHRYYEAETGRFLTRDPIKDGRNWYGYCGGSPVAWADLDGLEQVLIIVGPAKTKPEAKTDRTIARERHRKYQEMGYTVVIIYPETVHHVDRELAEEDLLAIEVIAHGGRPGVPSARIGGPGSNRKVLVGSDKSVLLTPKRILSKVRTRLELLSLCVCDAGSPGRIEGWKTVPLTLVSYKGKVNTSEWNRQHPPKRLRSGPASR
jgi:RHS repeat-associated protein